MIPAFSKPLIHHFLDRLLAVFGLFLPPYFGLKVKLRYFIRQADEPDIKFIADRLVHPGQCVIDVGANVGLTARVFAKAVGPCGRVIAIEPERFNFSFLCANTLKLPQVEPHRLALSSTSEQRELFLNPVSGTGNSFFGKEGSAFQRVPCQSFDKFCDLEGIKSIDWLKIDVEGAELEVLRGMEASLSANPELRLLIEYCPVNLQRAGTSPEALLRKLSSLGFRISALVLEGRGYRLVETDDPDKFLGDSTYINLICSRGNDVS